MLLNHTIWNAIELMKINYPLNNAIVGDSCVGIISHLSITNTILKHCRRVSALYNTTREDARLANIHNTFIISVINSDAVYCIGDVRNCRSRIKI